MARIGALLLLLGTLLAGSASAMMRDVPFQDLVTLSDAVVSARVLEMQSHWLTSPHVIVTDVVLRVDEAWAGPLAGSQLITLEVRGGVVDGVRMWVEHEPSFKTGESMVLFLRRDESARWNVNALEQGAFRMLAGSVVSWRGEARPLEAFRADVRRLLPAREH